MGSSITITLRKLYREKLYALINVAGLSLGIACCLILALYLRSELTYDQYHVNHKKIFRVVNEFNVNGKVDSFGITSSVLGQMLKEEYPEVQDYVRLRPIQQKILYHYEDKAFYWDNVYFADENLFKVFTHDIIYGDPETALKEPNTAAVNQSFARTFFGDENPIGKVITGDNGVPNTITLVFADLPENSHIRYEVIGSYNNPQLKIPENVTARKQQLMGVNDYTFLVMDENYNVDDFKRISTEFFDRNMAAQGKQLNATWRAWLQPLKDMHLYSDVAYDEPTGNLYALYGFAAVAVFILAVACINYINLATARYARRAREVGMRKILGAGRGQLIAQFMGEALCFSLISLVAGILIVELALTLTPINHLLDTNLALNLTGEPALLGWLIALGVGIGVIAGIYPAFYLSSVSPLSALLSNRKAGIAGIRLREVLVLAQFTISVGVIACTLLMAAQMRYVSNKALGFNKDNRIIVTVRGVDLIEKLGVLKTELEKYKGILGVTASDKLIGEDMPINGIPIETANGQMETTTIQHMSVADDYLEVMGLELVEGRDFSKKLLTDVGTSFVVNETLVRKMGWDKAIGKRLQTGRVIGVIKDFHYASLHTEIAPYALHPFNDNFDNIPQNIRPYILRHMIVNISGEDIRGALGFLEDTFTAFDPKHPFEFKFLDDSLNELYLSEQRLMELTGIFAGICIFIACLGLFGLAAFTTEQRTKEIGIRKVLGASAAQIILLLSKNILALVVIGAVIASLASWYVMMQWLTGFAYHTEINPLVFLLAAALAAAVAYITLALQSFKTASANPVLALRYE
ncbi:MAG: ABC transporter permease [Gammaproteobacteria bacterium]|nr:MAG: ABC transporter permease [Gammaproteobacteria bacterium]